MREPLLSAEPLVDAATVRAMEERSFNAWPAPRSVLLAGWSLRFAGGYTRRANSMNAIAPTDKDFADVLAAATEMYARENLPAVVRLTPLAGRESERALARAGWHPSEESLVLAGGIDPSFRMTTRRTRRRRRPRRGWTGCRRATATAPASA